MLDKNIIESFKYNKDSFEFYKSSFTDILNRNTEIISLIKKHNDESNKNLNDFMVALSENLNKTLNFSIQNDINRGNDAKNSKNEININSFSLPDSGSTNRNIKSSNGSNHTSKPNSKRHADKNNEIMTNIFKSIAKHLIDFKIQLKSKIILEINKSINDFQTRQTVFEQMFLESIDKQLNVGNKFEDLLIQLKSLESSNDEIINKDNEFKKELNGESELNQKWNFSTSVHFIGSVLTTIGLSILELYAYLALQ